VFMGIDVEPQSVIQVIVRGKVNILGGHSIGHSKQRNIYICPIPNDFHDSAMDVLARVRERQDALGRATRHVLKRVAKCTDDHSGISENVLY
jgi:hypothetical protein